MNLSLLLRHWTRYRPEKAAIVGTRSWSYRELDERVDRLAAALAGQGLGRGEPIAGILRNGIEFLEVFLACCRIGAVFVPLNYRLAEEELEYAIGHCRTTTLVIQPEYADSAAAILAAGRTRLRTVVRAEWDPGLEEVRYPGLAAGDGRLEPGAHPDAPLGMDDVQRIVYTSGTTSRPKAALLTHGQVIAGCAARVVDFRLVAEDVTITAGPLYHVGALDTFATAMIYIGGTIALLERFDPAVALEVIERCRVSATWLAPTMIRMLLDANVSAGRSLDSLRAVCAGGEASPASLLRRVEAELPALELFNGYGLTESQGFVTVLEPEDRHRKFGSVGRCAMLREMRIVDDEGRDLPPGEPGEVLCRGPVVFPGYLYDEAATAETLRDGWLHTGDIGYLDADGYLYIVDRKKDMILSGGENIASSEIERVLDQHDAVDEVAVVSVPDEQWGEVPVAFIVSRSAVALDAAALEAFCSQRLARFKVPKRFELVPELPRTATGKVLKMELRAMALR